MALLIAIIAVVLIIGLTILYWYIVIPVFLFLAILVILCHDELRYERRKRDRQRGMNTDDKRGGPR